MTLNAKGFQLTGKLSPDEGLQVQKDVLSYAHFQLIRGKISFKKNILKNSAFGLLYKPGGGNQGYIRQHEYNVDTDIQEPTVLLFLIICLSLVITVKLTEAFSNNRHKEDYFTCCCRTSEFNLKMSAVADRKHTDALMTKDPSHSL